jgi:hypothetical protein
VWSRTAVQLAAEEARRRVAVENRGKGLLDDPEGGTPEPKNGPGAS